MLDVCVANSLNGVFERSDPAFWMSLEAASAYPASDDRPCTSPREDGSMTLQRLTPGGDIV